MNILKNAKFLEVFKNSKFLEKFKTSKVLKRIILIPLCTILVIFMLLLITPILFKNQIMELAKTELNKMLLAKVEFHDLKLSFIRNFPSAYVALEGLEITGIDEFEDELLVSFDRLSVTVDIMSIIRMDNIEVRSVLLENARLNGRILEDGSANWNIIRPGEEKEETIETEKEESDPFVFNVGLRRFEIRNLQASFLDDSNDIHAEVKALNFILRGDMTKEIVDLNMRLGIEGIDFWMDGIRLANQAAVGFVSEVAADLKNFRFALKDNRFNLNEIVLKFEGSVEIQGDDINADVTFASERTDFKSLLSLVPAVYMTDFRNIRTAGSLALNGDIKGTYNKNRMPNANLNLSVDNASFSYPNLPRSVERINIALRAHYDGDVLDRSTLDVDRFNFEMAGNPFSAELHVKTPESDMQIAARFNGKLDFNSVLDIIPMKDLTLNGLLECDITLAGRMSTLQNEQYEDFQAEGFLKLTGFNFVSPDIPHTVKITGTQLNFTPRRVELVNFDAVIGSSDIAMNGSLENFIPFVFNDDTVRGTLALRSNTINLNEFMNDEPAQETAAPQEGGQLSVIEVPKNVDFILNVNIGNLFFDKLSITNTAGAVTVRDGRLLMQNLSMNLLEGNMTLNGEYNTQDIRVPFVNLDMNIRQFDITSALSSFEILEKILPEPQNYIGRVSATMTLNSMLDEHLSPVLDTINSRGRLQTQNLQLRNSKLFETIADLSRNERLRNPSLGNLNIGYQIRDGRLWIEEPIVMNVQQARIQLRGDQGLDTTLNYRIESSMPVSAVGSGATEILGRIPGGSRITEVSLTGRIQGTARNPEINLTVGDMVSSVVDTVRAQVTDTITQRVEEVSVQVDEEINRQIDRIMAEAQRQADGVRSNARQAAARVRSEANDSADRVIRQAGNNIVQRRIAEASAEQIRSEGENNARRLEREAETQAQAIMADAQRRADQLRR